MIRAIEECLPRSLRQRCLAHKMRNLQSKVPEDLWPEFQARSMACFQAPSSALARLLCDDIAATYARDLPSAVACLDDDFEASIAHLRFRLGPSPGDAHHQSVGAAVWGGTPPHQSDPNRLAYQDDKEFAASLPGELSPSAGAGSGSPGSNSVS